MTVQASTLRPARTSPAPVSRSTRARTLAKLLLAALILGLSCLALLTIGARSVSVPTMLEAVPAKEYRPGPQDAGPARLEAAS